MDAVRVALLREVLAGTEWLGATRRFAGALRGSVVSYGGGLLLAGTPEYEPWHLAAHLVDEAAWSGTPELAPTLVRSDGLGRIEAARRGETLLMVAPEGVDGGLLERVLDARRSGVKVLVLGSGEGELVSLAHESLAVPEGLELDLDTVQHLVSAAVGENSVPVVRGRRSFRDRLSRLADVLTAPPPSRW
ncbi:hypothetical protein [Streptomyces sp. GQFP]|uniref:hypothetical protein n=1 Tax=Streptomyces sp. GQFP TaxID=2907545 RepID=UPI001F1AB40D|nr:hypothetical protein [Streptomyces sp. GQFP]UIX35122.1 hypothetical protein LUX31_36815 [Streptomyces sp. GQFP]